MTNQLRLQRLGYIFIAVYLVFFVGGYATYVPQIRWFNHSFFTLLAGAWLGWRIWKNRNLPHAPLNWAVYAALVLGFLVVPFSEDPRMALENMWLPVTYTVIYLFIVNAFHYGRHRLVIEVLFFVSVLVIFLGFFQVGSVFFGWGIIRSGDQGWINWIGQGLPLPVRDDLRIFLPLGVSTQTAGFVAPVILVALAHTFKANRLFRTLLYLMIAALMTVLILTFSRGGLVSLWAGGITFFVLYFLRTSRLQNMLTRQALVIGVGAASLTAAAAGIVLYLSSLRERVGGDRIRQDLWRSAVEMAVDNPLTGVGPGLYGRGLREVRNPAIADDRLSTAHNVFLNGTAELGFAFLLIAIAALVIIVVRWWQLREQTPVKSERWYLLNGMMAALVGFVAHNQFDVLNTYAAIMLVCVLVVYVTVEPAASPFAPTRAPSHRIPAIMLFLIVVGYGIWFFTIVDPAHRHFIKSLDQDNDQQLEAERAIERDPALHLYELQLTYLVGQAAYDNPTDDNLADAVARYEAALQLEPTWTTGMMNLAALLELQGDTITAEDWLRQAFALSPTTPAGLHFARLAEINGSTSDSDIIRGYINGIARSGFVSLSDVSYLPLSSFWTETDLRREALERYTASVAIDLQYRIAEVHFPERRAELATVPPATAAAWWVIGQHALTVEQDPEAAITAFSSAITLNPAEGDYYASRARALSESDPEAALEDLDRARFLGTRHEYPNIIEASIRTDADEIEQLRLTALPPFILSQDYEGVVFGGRTANFIPYASVRSVGRGESVMAVWYDLAQSYEERGDTEKALGVYRNIRLHAPEEERARLALQRLE
jgi:tetratricopeptide (TPR) repeat protein/O-antigen ligase